MKDEIYDETKIRTNQAIVAERVATRKLIESECYKMLVDGKNRKSGVRASRERAKIAPNERQASP